MKNAKFISSCCLHYLSCLYVYYMYVWVFYSCIVSLKCLQKVYFEEISRCYDIVGKSQISRTGLNDWLIIRWVALLQKQPNNDDTRVYEYICKCSQLLQQRKYLTKFRRNHICYWIKILYQSLYKFSDHIKFNAKNPNSISMIFKINAYLYLLKWKNQTDLVKVMYNLVITRRNKPKNLFFLQNGTSKYNLIFYQNFGLEIRIKRIVQR